MAAYAFLTPWLIGFLAFTLGPMLVSAVLSLTDYQVLNPGATRFVGTSNFTAALHDPVLAHSLRVTLFFATLAVPADLAVGLVLALVVNARARGMGALRTVLFLPIMIGGAAGGSVAVALLWLWMFQPRFGLLNRLLALVHLPPQLWVASPRLVVPSLALMSLWGVGRSMLIYLAALQRVPTDLVWAAQMDGAGAWRRFVSVVLPLISPAILFNLVLDLIYAMQAFTPAYVVTNGGPGDSSLFFMLYLYRNAFTYLHMGYASALAWLLFALTLALTVMIFRTARSWVFYEGAPNR
ncbi:MAG: carbohydrate ABC transporter permease [Acidimicrobiales bacterium]